MCDDEFRIMPPPEKGLNPSLLFNPMMHPREVLLIEKYIINLFFRKQLTIFEWGMGGTTLFFAPRAKEYHCVDNNRWWYDTIKQKIKERGLTNIKHKLLENKNDYIHAPNLFGNTIYDIVIIDGYNRFECAMFIKEYIMRHSVVFIHDYYPRQEHYKKLEEYYTIIEGIDDTEILVNTSQYVIQKNDEIIPVPEIPQRWECRPRTLEDTEGTIVALKKKKPVLKYEI